MKYVNKIDVNTTIIKIIRGTFDVKNESTVPVIPSATNIGNAQHTIHAIPAIYVHNFKFFIFKF